LQHTRHAVTRLAGVSNLLVSRCSNIQLIFLRINVCVLEGQNVRLEPEFGF
jgi:hypothetical protein